MEGVLEENEHSTANPTLEQCIAKLTQLFRVHGNQAELVKGPNQGTKSELCAAWLEGQFCSFFPNCHFAHGWADVKPRIYERKMFKVRPCLSENCLYTTRCQFFHDDIVYTLTPELRVFYSEREKMHRITLATQNGKLLVISLREPENPERCPYYVELMPFLTALYRILPSTSPAFLNKINKQTTCFTSTPPQSKIKVQPQAPTTTTTNQLGYLPLVHHHQQHAHGHHLHHQAHHHHTTMQHPFIQMPTAYHPQYFAHAHAHLARHHHQETSVMNDAGTPKPIARPLVNIPDTGSNLSNPSLYVQSPMHNAWSQIPANTIANPATATVGTPLPTQLTTHNHQQALATYSMTQMTGEQAENYSNMENIMQQFGALSVCAGTADKILENEHGLYINENFNQVLPQPNKMQSFNSTPSRPQPAGRKPETEFKISSRRALNTPVLSDITNNVCSPTSTTMNVPQITPGVFQENYA